LLALPGDEPFIWAEYLFVDLIGDIAVLGSPDDQELYDQAEAYEEFIDQGVVLPVGDIPKEAEARSLVAVPGGQVVPLHRASSRRSTLGFPGQ
jgi:hypothetical protein